MELLVGEAGRGLAGAGVGRAWDSVTAGQPAADAQEENVPKADLPTFIILPGASSVFNPLRNGPVSKPDKGCLVFAGVCKAPVAVAGPFALHKGRSKQGNQEPFTDSG